MHAKIPPLPLDSESVSVLASGNARQRAALNCIEENNLFACLAEFRGVLASTIALGIDTPTSDLDFLCEASDLEHFARSIERNFGQMRDFRSVPTPSPSEARCYSLWCSDFEIEIFGSAVRLEDQSGFRHHIVMAKLINLGGESFRDKLRNAKLAGMKSEPAIASLLGLPGDPYEGVAALINASGAELYELLARAALP